MTAYSQIRTTIRVTGSLHQILHFYLVYPATGFCQTASGKSGSGAADITAPFLAVRFALLWPADVRLLSIKNEKVRAFYESEALHGG